MARSGQRLQNADVVTEGLAPQASRAGSPAVFKRTIALHLRKWRLEAGLGQKDAASRLDRTTQHISNLESDRLPSAADLELLLELYGKEERIPFMRELLSAARKASWWKSMSGVVPKWFDLYLGLEEGAVEISSFDTVVVPGLLQTRAYAEAVLRGDPDLTEDEVAQRVALRLRRQEILERQEDPVHLSCVLDESVLLRRRGDGRVMREQLARLLELSERPRIDLRVLPLDAGSTPAQDGGNFKVLRFAPTMEGDPGVVYLELVGGGEYVEKQEEIAAYQRALDRLRAFAADQEASRGIIGRVMEEVAR